MLCLSHFKFFSLVITDETNEEGLTADGPQRPIPSIRLPPPQPEQTVITKDGESVAQFADLVIAQSTWSGKIVLTHLCLLTLVTLLSLILM